MSLFFEKFARVHYIIFLFFIAFSFNVFVFPSTHIVNSEIQPLDIQLFYSPQKAYEMLEKYSEAERENYLLVELTVDILYPIVYTILLCLTIFLLFRNQWLALFPCLIFAFDIFENIGIVTMIIYFPSEIFVVALLTSISTSLKWSFAAIAIAIILFGFLKMFVLKLGQQKKV